MKADVTLAGDTIHIVVENPERKLDGQFALTFEAPVDVAQLCAQLRDLADQIAAYASQFTGLSVRDVALGQGYPKTEAGDPAA